MIYKHPLRGKGHAPVQGEEIPFSTSFLNPCFSSFSLAWLIFKLAR